MLQAIEAGKDTVFTKPTLNSATPTEGEKMEFKIDRAECSEDTRTYENNKTKLTITHQPVRAACHRRTFKGMNGYGTGQYDILWVLSVLNQMCIGIRNDQIPLLQTYNAIRKVFTYKQQ